MLLDKRRSQREFGFPERDKVLPPANRSLCGVKYLPKEVEMIGPVLLLLSDKEHSSFRGLKWTDSTHLSDFFISEPEHH